MSHVNMGPMATWDRAAPRTGWTAGIGKEQGWWVMWPKSRHHKAVPTDGKAGQRGQVQANGVYVTASMTTGPVGLRDGDRDGDGGDVRAACSSGQGEVGGDHWVPSWQVCGREARVLRVEKGFFIGVPSHTAFGRRNTNLWSPCH